MKNFGFVFPGQGSQKLGMLSDLAASYSIIEQTFAEASEVLNLNLWEVCQRDGSNSLGQTHITQPALLAASVAIWRLWELLEAPRPNILAGHSLGEYSALVCADVLSFADAIRIVHHRGQYMQSAVPAGTGKMAAIVGLEKHQIHEICNEAGQKQVVSSANFNSLSQTVIAGNAEAVERAMVLCKEAGAKRVLPLNVSVPSHCALMRPAGEQFAKELDSVEFASAKIPIVHNYSAKICDHAETIKVNLVRQLYSPVLWVDSVQLIYNTGVSKLVEIGPGKVLSGLIKRIEPDIACFGSDEPSSLESAIAEMSA